MTHTSAQDEVPSIFLLSQSASLVLQNAQSEVSRLTHTGSRSLDSLITQGSGRIWTGLIELCGPPGIGKTQISLQICVNAILKKFNGLDVSTLSKVVYVSTEGPIVYSRVHSLICYALEMNFTYNDDERDHIIRCALKNLQTMQISSHAEMIALSYVLLERLNGESGEVEVVVVDGLASPLRAISQDVALRKRILKQIGESLSNVAIELQIPIILTNSMSMKIGNEGAQKGMLVPALGESLTAFIALRIVLFWKDDVRHAELRSSVINQSERRIVCFRITDEGVRDVAQFEKDSKIDSPRFINQRVESDDDCRGESPTAAKRRRISHLISETD